MLSGLLGVALEWNNSTSNIDFLEICLPGTVIYTANLNGAANPKTAEAEIIIIFPYS